MSKRNFRMNPNDRLLDKNSSRKRFHGAPDSKTHIITAKSPTGKGSDFDRQRRVRVTAKDIDSAADFRAEASLIPSEKREVKIYATSPKTSEYAFFKKLKEDAGQRCHSSSIQRDAYLLKKPKSNDCSRERTNDVRVSSKYLNRPTLTENMPAVNSDAFLSPFDGALKKSEEYPISSTGTKRHFERYADTSQLQDMFLHEETQSMQGETFVRKRKKLRQWIADASFPDIDKLCSKGHDIVSMLLSRLFSNTDEENKYNYLWSGKAVTSTRHDLLVSHESDSQYKEHYQIPRNKLLQLDSTSNASYHLLSPMFQRSDERIISYAKSPTYHSHKFEPSYSITEPESDIQYKEHYQIPRKKLFVPDSTSHARDHLSSPMFQRSDERITSFPESPTYHSHMLEPPYRITETESDIQYKEHYQIPRKKLLELDSTSHASDLLSSPMFQRSDERITSFPESPTYHSHMFEPPYRITETESDIQYKEHYQIPRKKLLELDSTSHASDLLSSPTFQRSDERITSFAESPTYHSHMFEPPYHITETESDIQYKEHYQIPRKKLLELDSTSHASDLLSSPTFQRSEERIISYVDSPTYHSHMFQPPYSKTETESDIQYKEHYQIPRKKLLELDSTSHASDLLSSPTFQRSEERIISCVDSPTYHSHMFQPPYSKTETESDIQYKEHYQIPRKKLLELDSTSHASDHLSSPMFQRSEERIFSYAESPIYHSHKFQPPYSITEPECNFGGTASFSANNDMTLCFLFNQQEHKSIAWNHFQELGKLGRETNPLLENDFDSPPDEIDIPTSLANFEEQTLNSILGARRLCSSSILSNQPLEFNAMLDLGLLKGQEFRFGQQYVYKDLDTDFNRTSLSFSFKRDCLKLSEDCNNGNSCVQEGIYVSPYQPLFRGSISNDYFHHRVNADTEAWLSSSFNLISGRRCLSLASPHQNHQNPNHNTLQLAMRESMSDDLLQDNYKQDLNDGMEKEMVFQLREDMLEIHNSSFLHISMQRDNEYSFLLHDDGDNTSEEDQTHNMLF